MTTSAQHDASDLCSLTYLSTATAPFGRAELEDLLRTARSRNHERHLTGLLLYAGGHFIQTLEGLPAGVDATYAEIAGDGRHRDVFVALREPIAERHFPEWSMGFETLSPAEAAELPGFNHYLEERCLTEAEATALGRAGVFHRVFRDQMR